jgi:hypothetical protein
MKLLLAFLALAFLIGAWEATRGRLVRVWPLVVISAVVAFGYYSRRFL